MSSFFHHCWGIREVTCVANVVDFKTYSEIESVYAWDSEGYREGVCSFDWFNVCTLGNSDRKIIAVELCFEEGNLYTIRTYYSEDRFIAMCQRRTFIVKGNDWSSSFSGVNDVVFDIFYWGLCDSPFFFLYLTRVNI